MTNYKRNWNGRIFMQREFILQLFDLHKQYAQQIPSPEEVSAAIDGLLGLLFPELSDCTYPNIRAFEQAYQAVRLQIFQILERIERHLPASIAHIEGDFFNELPRIRKILQTDAEAIWMGDPAATTRTEVIRTYPGFYAVAIYRIANTFHRLNVPLIPRILTEYAHSKTGIDIHPAATIGDHFCIDHGTGIVIGETVEIGNHVKLYQGVTLGALSVRKDMAQTKRHPTIEDHVIIYAGATILGGDTTIGHNSIIGGNVWITSSLAPNSKVYYKSQQSTDTEKSL